MQQKLKLCFLLLTTILLLTTYCLLLTTYYFPLTTYYLPLTTCYLLRTTNQESMQQKFKLCGAGEGLWPHLVRATGLTLTRTRTRILAYPNPTPHPNPNPGLADKAHDLLRSDLHAGGLG